MTQHFWRNLLKVWAVLRYIHPETVAENLAGMSANCAHAGAGHQVRRDLAAEPSHYCLHLCLDPAWSGDLQIDRLSLSVWLSAMLSSLWFALGPSEAPTDRTMANIIYHTLNHSDITEPPDSSMKLSHLDSTSTCTAPKYPKGERKTKLACF